METKERFTVKKDLFYQCKVFPATLNHNYLCVHPLFDVLSLAFSISIALGRSFFIYMLYFTDPFVCSYMLMRWFRPNTSTFYLHFHPQVSFSSMPLLTLSTFFRLKFIQNTELNNWLTICILRCVYDALMFHLTFNVSPNFFWWSAHFVQST